MAVLVGSCAKDAFSCRAHDPFGLHQGLSSRSLAQIKRIVSSGDENAKDDVRVGKDQRNNNEMKIDKTCIRNMITYVVKLLLQDLSNQSNMFLSTF